MFGLHCQQPTGTAPGVCRTHQPQCILATVSSCLVLLGHMAAKQHALLLRSFRTTTTTPLNTYRLYKVPLLLQ